MSIDLLAILFYNIETKEQTLKLNNMVFRDIFKISNEISLLDNLIIIENYLKDYLNECIRVSNILKNKYVTSYIGTIKESEKEYPF